MSGAEPGSEGSLIEMTRGGAEPLAVAGVERSFLADGDEVVLQASAEVAPGVTITLGEAAGRIVPGEA